MTAFARALAHARVTAAIEAVADRTSWDRETIMPAGAAAQRADEMAALEAVIHARLTDPGYGDDLDAAEAEGQDGAAMLYQMRRARDRAAAVPANLATALARETSLAQGLWGEARAADDVAHFLPALTRVVTLKREEAAALARGGDPYDALIDGFEPGTTAADLARLFEAMAPRLAALRDAVLGRPSAPALDRPFHAAGQDALSRELAQTFGYDLTRGRLDTALHPFSSGSGSDVRITTRYDPANVFDGIYSTIHEAGHAVYEQGVDPALALTPLGDGASMGVHESQARLFENQLGRSRAFCTYLFARMHAHFGDLGVDGPEAFWRAANAVGPSYLRTEADEVQYNLHVVLRFELERDLIAGRLGTRDLEASWNDRFAALFGYPVPRPSLGLLQDVHWAVGLFGYFPTYTLGNVYAGALEAAMRADGVPLDANLERGDTRAAVAWLGERVHRHGRRVAPGDLVEAATGGPATADPYLEGIEAKFARLYGL